MTLPDDAIMTALRACDDDDRDALAGGWHPTVICDVADCSRSTCEKHLRRLQRDGHVVRVRGLGPRAPRESWLPADHPDAPEPVDEEIRRRVWIDEGTD